MIDLKTETSLLSIILQIPSNHISRLSYMSVGSIKLYVSFAEYGLFYRALLQKRPIILRRLLHVATP